MQGEILAHFFFLFFFPHLLGSTNVNYLFHSCSLPLHTLNPELVQGAHTVQKLSQHLFELNTVVLANVSCILRAVPGILRNSRKALALFAALKELTVSSEGCVQLEITAKTQECEIQRVSPSGRNHTAISLLSQQG